jgi:hypothetical protein
MSTEIDKKNDEKSPLYRISVGKQYRRVEKYEGTFSITLMINNYTSFVVIVDQGIILRERCFSSKRPPEKHFYLRLHNKSMSATRQ